MITRTYWLQKLTALWQERRIIWLSGVRRVGKTSLGRQIPESVYLNCDLPSTQRLVADPEFFLGQQTPELPLILDEIHRLADPSLLLKIAADAFPRLRILATGSSTLHATRKFRDTLTDRKRTLLLPPVLWRECLQMFGVRQLDERLLRGGFPGLLLAAEPAPSFFEDWMDGFYARDIQELFGVRNRTGFLTLLKLLCLRSGGLLDITDLAKEAGLSRPTVMAHLDALEISHAIHRIPPFCGGGQREIIRQPRVYAFDTGLIAHVRGWEKIREHDRGLLWENLVLDELRATYPLRAIHYWRDKQQREIDFVIEQPQHRVDTVEAKIKPDAFDPAHLRVFRSFYPAGDNYLLCPVVDKPQTLRYGSLIVRVCGTQHLPLMQATR
jgi:predicted AAA+ superfamily ATPase